MADRAQVHSDHDLEAVAAFVDDPTGVPETVRIQVANCPDCTALAADLRSLAEANASLAVPARVRDFRLTPDDAVRLATMAPEPGAYPSRLGFDMTTPAPDHATHDPMLVAAHLDGTLPARDATRVSDWLDACSACATLRADFAALAVATHELPTPPRRRDFRLTESDAQRARARGWRRALAVLASPRGSFTRPLAIGLTTMGLAGLVFANIPSATLFGSAAGAAPSGAQSVAAPPQAERSLIESSAPVVQGAAGAEDGLASAEPPDIASEYDPEASAADLDAALGGNTPSGRDSAKGSELYQAAGDEAVAGVSALVVVSALLLLTGLALAFLRWGARRLGNG